MKWLGASMLAFYAKGKANNLLIAKQISQHPFNVNDHVSYEPPEEDFPQWNNENSNSSNGMILSHPAPIASTLFSVKVLTNLAYGFTDGTRLLPAILYISALV